MARGWRRGGVRFGLVAALTLLLAGCGPAVDTPEACALVRKAELPVRFEGNLPVVEIKVNGEKARMIFDTGADATYLEPAGAKRLGLTTATGLHGFGVGITGFPIPQMPVSTEGSEIAPGLPLVGRLFAAAFSFDKQSNFDGLLGREAMQNFDLDVDFPNDRIVLYQARHCPSRKPEMGMDAEELPRPEFAHGGSIPGGLIAVELDGHQRAAIIDTGSAWSLVSNDAAMALGVTDEILKSDGKQPARDASGLPLPTMMHRFRTLKVGSAVIETPVMVVMRIPPINGSNDFEMLLGNDYLRLHRVWISFTSARTYAVVMSGKSARIDQTPFALPRTKPHPTAISLADRHSAGLAKLVGPQ